MDHWRARAEASIEVSDSRLRNLRDPHLRRLLHGVPDEGNVQLGSFFHVAPWEEMLLTAKCCDQSLVSEIMSGVTIVGDTACSRRWPQDRKAHIDAISVDQLQERAWEFRGKVVKVVSCSSVTVHSPKVWKATLKGVEEGSAIGPFFKQDLVSKFLGADCWISTQRFEVQKNKVRGVDSATVNGINVATVVSEKLQLPSTDSGVAAIKFLLAAGGGRRLSGWVLDERGAYRQVPIRPAERRWTVVCLKEPLSGGAPFLCDDRALVRLGLGCIQLQPALGGHHGGSSAPVLGCRVQLSTTTSTASSSRTRSCRPRAFVRGLRTRGGGLDQGLLCQGGLV